MNKVTETSRWDLTDAGETQQIEIQKICDLVRCKVDKKENFLTISHPNVTDTWKFGSLSLSSSDAPLYDIQLPSLPVKTAESFLFPAKIIVERAGYTTVFDQKTKKLHIFDLPKKLKTIELEHEKTIEGSSLKLNYFVNAHETEDHIYLKMDNSSGLFKFDKKDWSFKNILVLNEYGRSVNFLSDNEKIYLLTTSGAILQFKNEKLEEVLTGTGDKRLDDEGKTLHFSQFKNTGITQLKKHPEKNILYGFDYQAVGRFYALNLDTKKVKLIKKFENHDFKSLDMFNDLPMLSGAKLTIVSPNSGEILQSECYSDLIGKDRIYGVKFLPNQNKWVFIRQSVQSYNPLQLIKKMWHFLTVLGRQTINIT